MNRTTFSQFRQSRIPHALGVNPGDWPQLASYANEAIQRLIIEGGDEGFWGTWAKMAFNVTRLIPYITTPRAVARLINADVNRCPVQIHNEFFEFLDFTTGLRDTSVVNCNLEIYERGWVPTFADLVPGNKRLRVYATDARDYNLRVLVQGQDDNAETIRSTDRSVDLEGIYLTLASPFVDLPFNISSITGLQKDVTVGDVKIFELDTVTGNQRLLVIMEPSEETAMYRRYYVAGLPQTPPISQVVAMAKLDHLPVRVDTDYLLIGNLPALKEECLALRMREMDHPNAIQMANEHHINALRLLRHELDHHLGIQRPSISRKIFGSDRLRPQFQ